MLRSLNRQNRDFAVPVA